MKKKILVGFDDSENAMRAIEFIAETFDKDHEISLFHVIQDTAALCDMNSPELTPYFVSQQTSFCSLEDQKKSLVEQALEKAKDRLVSAGFSDRKIHIKLAAKKKNVAKDIIDEAHNGYELIVLGRRGVSGIKEFLLGSISQKVLQLAKEGSILFVN